jgi:cellulose synthase/poly-beta-1,6-N-acetylglucosamine synthase-like glycosyltransferase
MQYFPSFELNFLGIVLLVFCIAVGLQLMYLLAFNFRLLLHKYEPDATDFQPPISIIVCARNEEDNLFKHLPILLSQNYPDFEVIVVNDQSQDDSNHIVKAFQHDYPNLRLIELEKNKHRKFGKKIPLTVGIKGAKHGLIMLTDADCKPNSKNWLKEMASSYTSNKQVVIGYGPFYKRKGFLNRFIRFDMVSIAISYLSAAKAGLPYMGVGRNMGYSKELFIDNEGFKKHYHIPSGDDDLLIRDVATRKNVAININPNTFVYSEAKPTWETWVTQKQRHFTTAPEYKLINKLFLGIFPFTLYLMWFSFFILLFNSNWGLFIGSLLLLRYALYWLVNGLLYRRLKMKDVILFFPFYELLHAVVMPFIYYANSKSDRKAW